MIINGKQIAQEIIAELKKQPSAGWRTKKFLAAILVGEDEASISFLKQKERVAKELGINFRIYKFSAEIKQDELRKEVLKIGQHKTCGGVIVQLPLPEHIDKHYVCNVIPREKDVDVLGERALGAFYTGRNPVFPPAVGVVEKILQTTNYSLQTSKVAVVGLGFLVGKPISVWLKGKVKELYLLDVGSDLDILKQADLVISGVGKPGLIKPEMLKDGSIVIDFGYSFVDGKISGDFDPSAGSGQAPSELNSQPAYKLINYTPTPGGTGPILVAKLFENFFKLNDLK